MTRRTGLGLSGAILAVVLLAAAALPPQELVDAARRGDVAAVRSLLQSGTDVNAAQGDGLTALHAAAETGNLEIVRVLLGARANVQAKTRIGGYTPLHVAARNARTEVVQALLQAGADPRAVTTTSGVTALHLAAAAINGEGAVRALLAAGTPVDARESAAGQTALMMAASAGHVGSVRALLAGGANTSLSTEVMNVLERMAIDRAAQQAYRRAVTEIRSASEGGTDREPTPTEVQQAIAKQRELLRSPEERAKILESFHPSSLARRTPLWRTDSGVESDVTVDFPPMWETWVGLTGGMTALLHAAREGRIEAAEALLDAGADIDQVGGDGSSPLVIAIFNGRYDMAMKLLERGANPNLATAVEGAGPLFALIQTQYAGLQLAQPQPRAHEQQQVEYLTVLNALLEAGADPNLRLKSHPWYWEFETGSRLGLDLTGATAFWRAAFAQDVDAMKALVAHGADPMIPTAWPELGLRTGRQQDGRNAEDSGLPVIMEGAPNMYPIHAAAGGGWLGVGAYMVNAVPNNFLNAVTYLVEEHGQDVNLRDSWGYAPLHYASVRGGNDLIQYLVGKGADVKVISRLGQSAADMARGGNGGFFERPAYPETQRLLESLGSPLLCFSTHFRRTGDYCAGSGKPPFAEDRVEESPPTL